MTIQSHHYVLAVHDLDRTRDWYQRVLGCEAEEVDPGNWVFLSTDGVTFMCGRCPDATSPADLGDHAYFAYLVVDDVDSWHERAEREGADVLKAPKDEPWGMREMALRTVDGHRMMVASKLAQS
ncbi:MAG: VOC family protein [Phycisphaerales bacterium]